MRKSLSNARVGDEIERVNGGGAFFGKVIEIKENASRRIVIVKHEGGIEEWVVPKK